MRQILAAAALCVCVGLTVGAQETLLQHRLSDDPVPVFVLLPPTTADADTLARRIAVAGSVPIGFEAARGDLPEPDDNRRRLMLTGKTVREALDVLVDVDNRYEWQPMHDVMVVRPRGAWNDAHNPLNQPIGEEIAWEGLSPQEFVVRVAGLVYGHELGERPAAPAPTDRTISVRLKSGTVLDLLNEAVREERQASWAVTYGGRRPFSPAVQFTIGLRDIDGRAYAFSAATPPPSMMQ